MPWRDLQAEWEPATFRRVEVVNFAATHDRPEWCCCTSSPDPALCSCAYNEKHGWPVILKTVLVET